LTGPHYERQKAVVNNIGRISPDSQVRYSLWMRFICNVLIPQVCQNTYMEKRQCSRSGVS